MELWRDTPTHNVFHVHLDCKSKTNILLEGQEKVVIKITTSKRFMIYFVEFKNIVKLDLISIQWLLIRKVKIVSPFFILCGVHWAKYGVRVFCFCFFVSLRRNHLYRIYRILMKLCELLSFTVFFNSIDVEVTLFGVVMRKFSASQSEGNFIAVGIQEQVLGMLIGM